MIRRATLEDVPALVEMGAAFHAYAPWQTIPLDREALARFLSGVVEKGAVFMTEEGMIGGVLSPLYFNPAYVVAAELFWWARSGGRALMDAFEAWAKEEGAFAVQFSALGDDKAERMDRLFSRAGYGRIETGYLKRF